MIEFPLAKELSQGLRSPATLRTAYCPGCRQLFVYAPPGDMPQLTDRQRTCLEGVLARKTAKQIGREIGITHHAVEQHLKAIRKKYSVTDTLQAAQKYLDAHTLVGPAIALGVFGHD